MLTGSAQQDLITIAGGAVSAGNPTIPRLYAAATSANGSPCELLTSPCLLDEYLADKTSRVPRQYWIVIQNSIAHLPLVAICFGHLCTCSEKASVIF